MRAGPPYIRADRGARGSPDGASTAADDPKARFSRLTNGCALECGVGFMLPVLDLDPSRRPAAAIGAVAVPGDQALQPHPAGMTEKVRADLALRELGEVDSIDAACQQAGEVCFAHTQRQLADIIAVVDQA